MDKCYVCGAMLSGSTYCSMCLTDNSAAVSTTAAPTTTISAVDTSSTVPTTDPITGLEIPRTLKYDTYKGHKLSVKPGEVETVSLYLNKTLIDDLNAMKDKIDESKTRVENKANENPPVGVPGSYSTAYDNAAKAISTALEDVQDAVTRLRNIADAICQYGDGGWATPASVLKHLNDFIYGTSGGGGGGDGGGGAAGGISGDENLEPTEDGTTIPDGGTGGNESDENLNNLDEEIVISEIAGTDGTGNSSGVVVPSIDDVEDDNLKDSNLENDSEFGNSTLSGFSSFIVPPANKNSVSGTKSASMLGAVGLAAAAAVALGVKIHHDMEYDNGEDDDEFIDDVDSNSIENRVYSNNKEMLKMKKKLFNIGGDD